MININNLKKQSASNLDRLVQAIDGQKKPAIQREDFKKVDDRFWKLDRDKSGTGSAIIRFLPAPEADGEDALPWVRYWDHGFEGPPGIDGKKLWYIEKSLMSIGQPDPVSELNTDLWNAGRPKGKDSPESLQASAQRRRLHYVSNILVVSDPKHPENEGKVFYFVYGTKIFEKVSALMHPDPVFADENTKKVNPFDPWKGANFKLRVKTVAKFPNYDASTFDPEAPFGTDAEIANVLGQLRPLKELLDPKNFKTYDQLKERLNKVLRVGEVAGPPKKLSDDPVLNEQLTKNLQAVRNEMAAEAEDDADEIKDVPEGSEEEWFQELAKDD